MLSIQKTCLQPDDRKGTALLLAILWLFGILLGIACFYLSRAFLVPLMRSTACGSVSIVGLIFTVFLPFLLSAAALWNDLRWLLLGTCFCKAFLFAFVSLGILIGTQSGGWLLRYFLLFGDCTALPVLYWYWLHCACAPAKHRWFPTVLTGSVLAFVVGLDYHIISPFLCV